VRISEDYVASELPYLGEEKFGRERQGLWADAASNVVISPEAWSLLADADSRRQGTVVFSVDAEVDRSAATIAVAGINQHGKTHVELIDKRQGVAWAAERLVELNERHRPAAIVLDGLGPAARWCLRWRGGHRAARDVGGSHEAGMRRLLRRRG
jgi:hypothetical protein